MSLNASRLFGTPICQTILDGSAAINDELLSVIDKHHEEAEPDERTDVWHITNGWEIGPEFFEQVRSPAAARLREAFEQITVAYLNLDHMRNDFEMPKRVVSARVAKSWATVLLSDAFLSDEHTHQNAHFVGVYYVSVPNMEGPAHAGALVLRDPRAAMHVIKLRSQKVVELITPQEGLMVIVPAYVAHGVRPFRSQGRRVSINCNITIEETEFI